MLRTSFLSLSALLVLAGCSSDPATPAAPADGGTDTATVDTGKPDTNTAETETGPTPVACQEPVDEVECTAPTKGVGQTVCNDAMLADLAEKCLAEDISVPAACAEWKAANAACASCVAAWSWSPSQGGPSGAIYPDDYRCYWTVMDAPCAKAASCMFDCEFTACGNCMDSADRAACYDGVASPGGACYDLASKEGKACFDKFDMQLKGCNVDEIYEGSPDLATLKQQVVRFLRGACRDNGVWTNAENPSGGDAGVTDSGSTDSGTAVTDAADAG
jgi:hypothetical protein